MLRGRALDGAKFRRQHPLGPYVLDFFCVEAGLVVEADGARHVTHPEADVVRDRWLRTWGCTVLRFPNREILEHPDRVLARIRAQLATLTLLLPAPPLPPGSSFPPD